MSSDDSIREALAALRPFVEQAARGSLRIAGIHGCALRAAVAKSCELATFVCAKDVPEQGFFLTATLRGVCEDLIVLTFLDTLALSVRNEFASLLMASQVAEGISAQSAFFSAERAWQPVLQPGGPSAADRKKALKQFSATLGWKGQSPAPSVSFMAGATGLKDLYAYFYSATSKWVHFSPHVLLRMGWGSDEGGLGEDTEWQFSTAHFGQYYTEFNRVNSLYLLIRLLRGPAAGLLSAAAEEPLLILQSHLEETLRWPEAVTFEEMNVKGPPDFMRVGLRIARERRHDAAASKSPAV